MFAISRDFIIVYIITAVAMAILDTVIQIYLGVDLGNVTGLLPGMIGALAAGHRHGVRTAINPTSGFRWKAAFWMTVTSFALGLAMLGVFVILLPEGEISEVLDAFAGISAAWLFAIIAVVLVVQLLTARIFFGLGLKQAMKASDTDVVNRF